MFKKYKRTNIAEIREVTEDDIKMFYKRGMLTNTIIVDENGKTVAIGCKTISISEKDLQNGSPKIGDRIARNPLNHNDQWLVSEKYFNENFEEIKQGDLK